MNGASPAEVLIQYLADKGFVTRPSAGGIWPAFVGSLPDDAADSALAIYDTRGRYHGSSIRDGQVFEHKGYQIALRASNYRDGYLQLEAITLQLAKVSADQVTVNGATYTLTSVLRNMDIIHLGKEVKKRRDEFVVNGIMGIYKN